MRECLLTYAFTLFMTGIDLLKDGYQKWQ